MSNSLIEHFKTHGYVHCFWLIVILATIIAAFVVMAPGEGQIEALVSFAATVTSLVLAVIAIIYSIVSNQGIASSVAATFQAALKVDESIKNIDNASKRISLESARLVEEVSQVPAAVNRFALEVGGKIDAFSELRKVEGPGAADQPSRLTVAETLCLYTLTQACIEGSAVDIKEIRAIDKYFGGILFGFFSSIRFFRPCGINIEFAGLMASVDTLGSFDPDKYMSLDVSERPEIVKAAKTEIDRQLGLEEPEQVNSEAGVENADEETAEGEE
jgi:hypothetical protein